MSPPDQDEAIDRWLRGEATPEERSALAEGAAQAELGRQVIVDGLLRAFRRPSVADRVMQRLPPGAPPAGRLRILPILLGLGLVMGLVAAVWLLQSRRGGDSPRPAMAGGRTMSLVPAADTAVDEGHPTAAPGTASDLTVCGAVGGQGIAYLRFQLPPGTVHHAVLILNSVSGTGKVSVHPVEAKTVGTWSESDLRWWHRLPVGPALGTLQQADGHWRLQIDGLQGPVVELALLTDSVAPIMFLSREMGEGGPRLTLDIEGAAATGHGADF